ncbi:tripartite tricarboxylate transporter TctB family protein [Salicibibacter cibi]|uniref:Tripartite tricarboxylate transporter TctB family protein n=1 Tax=Salicibibacter cibi TaxID=2743001 RepID=A0A7T6ZBN2_9BACI|nr:tripartite tricarboxylate transporter TctB family protein [Salicibibacter cibi]QQK80422.1 tripartite tricarboxylate transporter TctB family protein [Salicibibacter cibi]
MSEGNIYWRERYIYIFLIIISLLVLFIIPQQIEEGAPRALPYFSISIVLICSIGGLANCFRKKEVVISFSKSLLLKLGSGIFLYFLYVFLIEYIGYYILSVIFIVLALYLFKTRNIKTMIFSGVIIPLMLYLLLEQLLGLFMPTGILM